MSNDTLDAQRLQERLYALEQEALQPPANRAMAELFHNAADALTQLRAERDSWCETAYAAKVKLDELRAQIKDLRAQIEHAADDMRDALLGDGYD